MSGIRVKKKSALPAFFQATGLKPFASDAAYDAAKTAALENGDAYYNTTSDEIRVYDADSATWKTVLTAENSGIFQIDNVTDSTDKDTGALVVEGGVGIEKALNVGTNINVLNDIDVGNDLRVTGNTTMTGDLTVNGTTTTINTQTLEVEDPNILVNKGGNQAGADDTAGLVVEMIDATNAAMIYDKDATSRWRVGDVGSEIEVATISGSQTITNKTIDGTNATGTNTVSIDASDATYDNTVSLLVATDVQAAITEVDGNLDTHIPASTGVHGVTGLVVGTSDTQVLTNKTIDGDLNTISNLAHGAEVDNPTSGVHGVTGNVVGTTDIQTLTNKTIAAGSNTISGLAHGTEVDNPTSGVHGVTGTVVGTSDTQTLTNKTIDADSNTITNIEDADIKAAANIARSKLAAGTADHVVINNGTGALSSEASLAITRGGTGENNATAAFDALSPTTAKGDIIARDATGNTKLAVGTNGTVLTADSAELTGLKWADPQLQTIQTSAVTFTVDADEDIVFLNAGGGAFTANLFTASGNTGKVLTLKKTDTSTNVVTIDPNAAETIGGDSTTTLDTEGESIRIVSNGTNWDILERVIPSEWVSFTPTGSWTTNTTYTGRKRRVGDNLELDVYLEFTGAPNAVALTIDIPSSYTIDTAKRAAGTSVRQSYGKGITRVSSVNYVLTVIGDTTTTVKVVFHREDNETNNRINIGDVFNTLPGTYASGDEVQVLFSVPISGWNS